MIFSRITIGVMGVIAIGLELRGEFRNEVRTWVDGDVRFVECNGLPDHAPGSFPRRGNPNTIVPQNYRFKMPLHPHASSTPVQRMGWWWGVALNGVPFEPGTAEVWNNDRQSGWRYEAATGFLDLGLDEHHAHVQPNGAYHYHAHPSGLRTGVARDDSKMLHLGWAADGFPVYANRAHGKAHDGKSPLRVMKSSYRLKKGNRPGGDGPGGAFDGRFTEDFEFVPGSGDLDECNGRFGVSPEFPKGTYYYCITDEFPFIARMWRAQPDESFSKHRGGGPPPFGRGGPPPGPPHGPPPPAPPPIPPVVR
jgi:hypothetical protein